MKLRLLSAALASIVCTVGVLAQDPPPSSQSAAPKTITVSGCVQRAQATPTGTTGSTSSASASEPKFILTNATAGGSSSSSATAGTTGTASRSGASAASEYRLDASDAKLSPHVGHKVEITGTLDSASPSASTSSTSSASSSSSSNAPKLKVDDVKMVAATCP